MRVIITHNLIIIKEVQVFIFKRCVQQLKPIRLQCFALITVQYPRVVYSQFLLIPHQAGCAEIIAFRITVCKNFTIAKE